MPPAADPPDSGRHRLSPHVVGQRIVVRRLVPGETGPTGGPAFTDLLGVCLAWSDAGCVLQPEAGPSQTIPLRLIVSGKPVPPRASTRLRVSTRDTELRAAALWTDAKTEELGEWRLRTQPVLRGRLVKRANSCLAFGDPGMPADAALAAVEGFYAERDRPALIQVEEGGEVEAAALAAGWADLEPPTGNELRLASVARVRRALPASAQGTPVDLAITADRAVASIGTGCDPVAEGSATVDGDWVGLHGFGVDPAYRRRGHATALVAELLDWAAERGALTVWLQVEPGNVAAVALWDRLGLAPHHRSRYLTAPPA